MPIPDASPIRLYDTTLRDGTQREGLSLSVEDKVKIAAMNICRMIRARLMVFSLDSFL